MLKKISAFSSNAESEGHASNPQEQSLTTILHTREERTALLLLIAECTDSIQKSIVKIFDPKETGQDGVKTLLPQLPRANSESRPNQEQLPQTGGDVDVAGEPNKTDVEGRNDSRLSAQQEYERRVKEVSDPNMQGLKGAVLGHFQDWRERVLTRVGEVINSSDANSSDSGRAVTEDSNKGEEHDGLAEDEGVNDAFHELYPPTQNALQKLNKASRALILHSLLLLFLSLESYSAESRILLLHITSSLRLPLEALTQDEQRVAEGLLHSVQKEMNADNETKQKVDAGAASRKWKVGLGAVAGAALIGVTGGLAAPLLAAGVGSVMGGLGLGATAAAGYLGALAGSAPLVGVLFGAYGGRMTSQLVDSYAKEVEDFAFCPVHPPSKSTREPAARRLRVAIGVTGWLTSEGDVVKPWNVIGPEIEAFALRWELEVLISLGNALTTYIRSAAWGFAKTQIIKHTVFAALTAALWPLGIVKAARMIDNPFSVARSRADKAGKVLADALINKVQGERPVTLIGFSMGARVIYACLDELANRKAFGLVESAVLIGTPAPADSMSWRKLRSVVVGRIVNVYSSNDYLLAFLYRSTSMQYGIAGLQAIQGVAGIENVDVSEIVDGHTQYRFLAGKILRKIGFEDIDKDEAREQVQQLEKQEQQDEMEREQRKAAGVEADAEVENMKQEIERKNEAASPVAKLSEKTAAVSVDSSSQEKPVSHT